MEAEVAQERAPEHFPDELRLGVLAGQEAQEERLAAHFLACEACREPAFTLLSDIAMHDAKHISGQKADCLKARNALFRYFEQGRQTEQATIAHLIFCEECQRHFLDPAKAAITLEDDAVGGLD